MSIHVNSVAGFFIDIFCVIFSAIVMRNVAQNAVMGTFINALHKISSIVHVGIRIHDNCMYKFCAVVHNTIFFWI